MRTKALVHFRPAAGEPRINLGETEVEAIAAGPGTPGQFVT